MKTWIVKKYEKLMQISHHCKVIRGKGDCKGQIKQVNKAHYYFWILQDQKSSMRLNHYFGPVILKARGP